MITIEHANVAGALDDVALSVSPGRIVGLIGHNGSGKSTLGRIACGALAPDSGTVTVDGATATEDAGRGRIRRLVGYVGQNPVDQTVSTVVADEVAFGLRNIGLGPDEIGPRASRALEDAGLGGYGARDTSSLSGGELQRLVMASVLALEPSYVVLDEASSQLDSSLRTAFRALVRRLAHRGMGVVLITHDPLEVLLCDDVAVLESGRVTWTGSPRALMLDGDGLWDRTLPPLGFVRALRAAVGAGYAGPLSCTPEELAAWARRSGCADALRSALRTGPAPRPAPPHGATGAPRGLELEGAAILRGGTEVLHDVTLSARAGALTLVAGPSGAGKTTLAGALAGLLAPVRGTASLGGGGLRPGDVGLAFQNPESQLFLETVRDELAFAPRNGGCSEEEVGCRVAEAAEQLDLGGLLADDPFRLSGGQARRVALASVLTLRPRAVVLDEPTAGLDAPSRAALHRLVAELASRGLAVVVVSHDLEEWLAEADAVALMRSGRLAWSGMGADLERNPSALERAGLAVPESWRLASLLEADGPADPSPEAAAASLDPAAPPAARTAGTAPLARVDARVKMVLLLAATVAVFAAGSPFALVVWVAAALGILAASGADAAAVLKRLRPVLLLFVFIVCANLVSCDGSADIALVGSWGVSTAGAARAATAIVRIVLLVCLALSVAFSTTPTALADASTSLMRPLARFGVPVSDIGLALSMALRFMPVVSEEVSRIQLAQRARGVDFDGGSLARRIRAWSTVLTPLVVGLFRRADHVAESMDARCYGHAGDAAPSPVPLGARDRVALVAGLAGMAALTAASHLV